MQPIVWSHGVLVLVMKVMLAPILLAACSFAAWRWGSAVGGWLLGLPLVSGPVSMLLFVVHGASFAETAARGTLLGLLATGAFCVWYGVLARRARWWLALPLSYAVCLGLAVALSFASVPVPELSALLFAVLAALTVLAPRAPAEDSVPKPSVRRLLGKMAVAAVIVVGITTAATAFGPRVAGLLAPLPVLLGLMTTSAHRRRGHDAARNVLSGALIGCWGGAAFFSTLALGIGGGSPLTAYSIASVAGLAGAGLAVALQRANVLSLLASRAAILHRVRVDPRSRFVASLERAGFARPGS